MPRPSPRTPWFLVLFLVLPCLAVGWSLSGCAQPASRTAKDRKPGDAKDGSSSVAAPKGSARTLADPPAPLREFRGMFVTTAYNIDWPPQPGNPPADMRKEMKGIIDRAKELNVNVIMLQVRAHGDRHHRRTHVNPRQPWGRGLNKGADPDPHANPGMRTYDPLAEWIRACHRNGLELHAWINPFRVTEKYQTTLPVKKIGKEWYLDWKDTNVQLHALDVIEEILGYRVAPYGPGSTMAAPPIPMFSTQPKMFSTAARTAALAAEEEGVDGIIIDHYYPPDDDGKPGTQPTQPTTRTSADPPPGATLLAAAAAPSLLLAAPAAKTAPSVGSAPRRMTALTLRELTCTDPEPSDRFLCEVMKLVQAKPGAKLGFSPLDNFDETNPGIDPQAIRNAHARRWLRKGLLHYVVPGVYLQDGAKVETKLKKWLDANTFADAAREKPIVVAGLYTMRTHKPPPRQPPWTPWPASVILDHLDRSRTVHGTGPTERNRASGQAHYSTNSLRRDGDGGPPTGTNVGDKLVSNQPREGQYREPRLVPACVDTGPPPAAPDLDWDAGDGKWKWKMPGDTELNTGVLFWAVWLHDGSGWGAMRVLDRNVMEMPKGSADGIAVKAIDVFNHESAFAVKE